GLAAGRRQIENLVADRHSAAWLLLRAPAPEDTERQVLDREVGGRTARRLDPALQARFVSCVENVAGNSLLTSGECCVRCRSATARDARSRASGGDCQESRPLCVPRPASESESGTAVRIRQCAAISRI